MRDNLGFISLTRAWVGFDAFKYAIGHPYVFASSAAERANQLFGFDPALLNDPILLLMTWRRANGQEYLADLFSILVDVRDYRDRDAVKKIKDYQAYGISLEVGRLLRERGELERAALYLEVASQVKLSDYAILRQIIFLYKSQGRYCDMLRMADIGVHEYGYEFYLYRAQAYEGLQAWQLAIQDYQRAAELADNEKNRKDIQANIWTLQQRFDASAEYVIPRCEP